MTDKSATSQDFDPYYKWLGIPRSQQPPDHYQLLGIERFEDDADVISNAADRQTTHVRTFRLGKHTDLCEQLLNEISAARVCLLNAVRKEQYDRQLRTAEASNSPLTAVGAPDNLEQASHNLASTACPPVAPTSMGMGPRIALRPLKARRHPFRRSFLQSWTFRVGMPFAMFAGVVVVVVALAVVMRAPKVEQADGRSRSYSKPTAAPRVMPKPEPAKPPQRDFAVYA